MLRGDGPRIHPAPNSNRPGRTDSPWVVGDDVVELNSEAACGELHRPGEEVEDVVHATMITREGGFGPAHARRRLDQTAHGGCRRRLWRTRRSPCGPAPRWDGPWLLFRIGGRGSLRLGSCSQQGSSRDGWSPPGARRSDRPERAGRLRPRSAPVGTSRWRPGSLQQVRSAPLASLPLTHGRGQPQKAPAGSRSISASKSSRRGEGSRSGYRSQRPLRSAQCSVQLPWS